MNNPDDLTIELTDLEITSTETLESLLLQMSFYC